MDLNIRDNRGRFAKGNIPYTKGKKRPTKVKKKISETLLKVMPKGEKSWSWKGDKIKYRGLHMWVTKNLGKPRFCEMCGNRNLKHRQYHWANISRNYKRILTDWTRLCVKCHKKFDK